MSIFSKTIAMLTAIITWFSGISPVTFSPIDQNTVKLNFSIIADTHVDEVWNDAGRSDILVKGLKDMANAAIKSDALIIAGDLTERGAANEYLKLGTILKLYCKADNILPQMGNHDIRGIKDSQDNSIFSYQYSAGKYFELLDKAAGMKPDKIYFSKIIKGCYFIVLNPEGIDDNATVLSETQLHWLDTQLTLAQGAGNPVFIINHQPLQSVGKESAALAAVIQKYNGTLDIFFISGHYHDGFSTDSITNDGTLYFIDTPAYGKVNDGSYTEKGAGFQVELYDGRIVFRARNFLNGQWASEFDRTISLNVR